MQIDGFTIDVQRDGAKRTLRIQGRPYGLTLKLTLSELQQLALLFAKDCGEWADEERATAEAARPKPEPSAPVMIHPIAEEANHGN